MNIVELAGCFEKKDGVLGCLKYFDCGSGRAKSTCKKSSFEIECQRVPSATGRDAQRRVVLGPRVRQDGKWQPSVVAVGRG